MLKSQAVKEFDAMMRYYFTRSTSSRHYRDEGDGCIILGTVDTLTTTCSDHHLSYNQCIYRQLTEVSSVTVSGVIVNTVIISGMATNLTVEMASHQ